jgi:3-oxoadipate enol-lactonase
VPHTTANEIDIYYELHGEGPRLLFCNGSGATLEQTGFMLAPYAERFEVLAFDQRGLGRTSIPPGPYEMADYAADAAGLLDAVGWDSCRVTGTSFGGMVAQEFAVTFPHRVERLVLACTSPGGDFASYPLHQLAEMPPDEAAALGPQLLDTRFTPEWLAGHDDGRALAEMVGNFRGAPKTDDARRGELAQLDARSRLDVLDRLDRITCPTLVASGRYDGIAPPRNGEEIASRIPGAELRLYEGGHLFMVQDPNAMPDMLGFLEDGLAR